MRHWYVVIGYTKEENLIFEEDYNDEKHRPMACGDKLFIKLNFVEVLKWRLLGYQNNMRLIIRPGKTENQINDIGA